MTDELAAYQTKIRKKLAPLEDVFAKALLGDFTTDLEIPEEDDELAPVFVGVNVLLASIREQIDNYEQLNRNLADEVKAQTGDINRHNAVLEAMSYASTQFLQLKDWHKTVNSVISRLGQAMDVSRVYIFDVIDPEAAIVRQLYEWTAPGVKAFIDDPSLQHFSFAQSGFNRWVEAFQKAHHIGGIVSEFPKSEQKELRRQAIKSLLIFPIFDEGKWWGIIGFDDTRLERKWTKNDIAALETSASILGIAIQHYRTEQEASKRTRELEVLNRAMIGRELKMIELKQQIKKLRG